MKNLQQIIIISLMASSAEFVKSMDLSKNGKIIGGICAQPSEFPSQIGILKSLDDTALYCTGIVLGPLKIATAGQCCSDSQAKLIMYHDAEDMDQVINISQLISHPNYNPTTKENNVCKIYLSEPLEFTKNVQPIRICSKAPTVGTSCVVTGWNRDPSCKNEVKKIPLSIVNGTLCDLVENAICTVHEDIHTPGGICQEDKGGSLICNGGDGGISETPHCLHGITLIKQTELDCNNKDPYQFTSASSYKDWLETD